MPLNTTDPTKPDYVRPEVVAADKDLSLIHDLQGGPQAMWAASTRYIRRWKEEETATYDIRRLCEPCEGLFIRTLSASVGKLFAKPPTLAFPVSEAELRAHWDDLDAGGTKGDVACKEFAADSIGDGLALILVDHPSAPGTTVTAANERALGLRPTWAFYARAAVCSWRVATVDNVEILTQIVLREGVEEAAEAFGVATAESFRELYVTNGVAGWRLWRSRDDGKSFGVEKEDVFRNRTGQTRGTIPLAIGYAGRKDGPLRAAPPLRDVAYANLAHWRMATELTFGTQVCAIEQPVITGDLTGDVDGAPGKVLLGWLKLVKVSAEGDFKWVGPSGAGLAQLKERKEEKEHAVAQMGLSFMARDTRAAETAEAHRLDAAAEDSTLATSAQGIEDAINQAWVDHCWYMGIAAVDAPTVTLNRDYEGTVLSPQHAQAIAALVAAGLPIAQAARTLVLGGFLRADEADIEAIVLEWEMGQADQQARAAEAAADRAAGFWAAAA